MDVSVLEKEREQLRSQLRQLSGAKNKLINMLDKLDVSDKHYDRKYQDMQDRLDNLYDKIGEIDELLKEINEKNKPCIWKTNYIKTGLSNFTVF